MQPINLNKSIPTRKKRRGNPDMTQAQEIANYSYGRRSDETLNNSGRLLAGASQRPANLQKN